MKMFLLAVAVLVSTAARADQASDFAIPFINFIGNTIAHNINNHNNNNNNNWTDEDGFDWQGGKVILQDQGNKILLGQLVIDENGTDSFALPKCNLGKNKTVSQIRLAVNQADVSIDSIRVTFQNGKTQIITVDNQYSDGDSTQWFALKGLNERCIQKIRVSGQVLDNGGWDGGPGHGGPGHNGPGHNGPGNHVGFGGGSPGGSIGFGNGGIDINIGIGNGGNGNGNGNHGNGGHGDGHGDHGPGGHNGNDKAIISVVGLKI